MLCRCRSIPRDANPAGIGRRALESVFPIASRVGWILIRTSAINRMPAHCLRITVGGSIISGTFGFRTGLQTPRYALKVALRPGFVSYDHAYLTSPIGIHLGSLTGPVIIPPAQSTPQTGRITHFVTSLSINGDYAISRHLLLRGTFGMTAIRYKTDYYDRQPGRGSPPYLFYISPDVYATRETGISRRGRCCDSRPA